MLTYIVISPNIAEPMSLENVDGTRGPSLRRASSKVFAALTARLKLGLSSDLTITETRSSVFTSSCVPVAERLGQVRHRAVEVIFVVLTTGTLEHGLDPCFHVDQGCCGSHAAGSIGRSCSRCPQSHESAAASGAGCAVVVEGPQSSHVEVRTLVRRHADLGAWHAVQTRHLTRAGDEHATTTDRVPKQVRLTAPRTAWVTRVQDHRDRLDTRTLVVHRHAAQVESVPDELAQEGVDIVGSTALLMSFSKSCVGAIVSMPKLKSGMSANSSQCQTIT